jgi:hypothetical protein
LLAGEAVAGVREIGEALDQGERLAEAEVGAGAEGEDVTGVGRTAYVEAVGIVERLGISMRRSDVDEDGSARLKVASADRVLLDHEVEQHVRGAVSANRLDDGSPDEVTD